MALNDLNTNWKTGSYASDALALIGPAENANIQDNLSAHSDRIISIAIGYGYDLLSHNNAEVSAALGAIGITVSASQLNVLTSARSLRTAIKASRGDQAVMNEAERALMAQYATQLHLSLTDVPQAQQLFQYARSVEYEVRLAGYFTRRNATPIGESRERIALLSMVYQGDPGGQVGAVVDSVIRGERAEAWFRIRYLSRDSGRTGDTSRSAYEAAVFGLYGATTTASNITDLEARATYQMYTRHRAEIEARESRFTPTLLSQVNAKWGLTGSSQATDLLTALGMAAEFLLQRYVRDPGYGDPESPSYRYLDIFVARDASGQSLRGTVRNDLLIGGTRDDLLTGGAGNDVLNGLGGADSLSGDEGDDFLDGGPDTDRDRLSGGTGFDTYVLHKGGGGDSIIDADGRGRILIDGSVLAINFRGGALGAINEWSDPVAGLKGTFFPAGASGLLEIRNDGGTALGDFDVVRIENFDPNLARQDRFLDIGFATDNRIEITPGRATLSAFADPAHVIPGATSSTLEGADIIVFNRGDDKDTILASAGHDNTVSLGGGIKYEDIALTRTGNDLVLGVGSNESLTFKDWYLGNKSVATLQTVTQAMSYYSAASTDPLKNRKIESFDFGQLVDAYDNARGANPTLANWSVMSQLPGARLAASDTEALGGDIAYRYGKNNSLTGMNLALAQGVLDAPSLGLAAQTLAAGALANEGAVQLK